MTTSVQAIRRHPCSPAFCKQRASGFLPLDMATFGGAATPFRMRANAADLIFQRPRFYYSPTAIGSLTVLWYLHQRTLEVAMSAPLLCTAFPSPPPCQHHAMAHI